jgi:hypothetical protein
MIAGKVQNMALFYTAKDEAGRLRWYISEAEARYSLGGDAAVAQLSGGGNAGATAKAAANPGGGGAIQAVELDELIMRGYAVKWLNACEVRREAARKREAAKTAEQKKEIMRKVWQKRKESE